MKRRNSTLFESINWTWNKKNLNTPPWTGCLNSSSRFIVLRNEFGLAEEILFWIWPYVPINYNLRACMTDWLKRSSKQRTWLRRCDHINRRLKFIICWHVTSSLFWRAVENVSVKLIVIAVTLFYFAKYIQQLQLNWNERVCNWKERHSHDNKCSYRIKSNSPECWND